MIVLVGASASGKTEIAKLLYKKYGYKKCITTTTRSPRNHEVNGIDYHFLSQDAFQTLMKKDAFLEVSIYNHHYYGFQKKDVMYKGVVVLDPNGANAIIKADVKDVMIVYVYSDKNLRKQRMINRGDHLDEIHKRLISDDQTFNISCIKRIDLMLENHEVDIVSLVDQIHRQYMNQMKAS